MSRKSEPDPSDVAPPSDVEAQALDWFFRQRGQALTPSERTEFGEWMAASTEHAREYAQLEAVWTDMDQLPDSARLPGVDAVSSGAVRGRRWAPTAVAFAVLLGIGWAGYEYFPIKTVAIANNAHQTRPVDLPDGTQIRTNIGTRLTVRYTLARREVALDQGEAFFVVGQDRRPFTVVAGTVRIRDIGTEFNVLALPKLMQVGVKSGIVVVTPDAARPDLERELHAGDVATIDLGRGTDPAENLTLAQTSMTGIGSWREGLLVVQAEPLERVIGKLARYRDGSVTVDAIAGAMQVSGTIDLRRPDAFLRALPVLLPGVRLEWQANGSVTVTGKG